MLNLTRLPQVPGRQAVLFKILLKYGIVQKILPLYCSVNILKVPIPIYNFEIRITVTFFWY